MLKIKKRENAISVVIYMLVLMVILSSKTVFFGIIYMRFTMILTLIALLFYNIYITGKFKMHITRNTKMYIIYFAMLLVFVSLFYIGDILLDLNSYVGALVLFFEVLLIGMLVVNSIPKDLFVRAYVNIMIVISVISLICFFMSMADSNSFIRMCKIYESGGAKYIGLPWYTYGWQNIMDNGYIYNYMFGRNAGPFWEPGAFQGFLIVALFLLLSYKDLFKKRLLALIILLFTLLTTQSTTAYIVLLLSFLGYHRNYAECMFGEKGLLFKKKITRGVVYFFSLIVIVFIAYVILSSGNITKKFSLSSGSYVSRLDDINSSLNIIFYNPIAGIGLGATSLLISSVNKSTVAATTILAIATRFGIPFLIYYVYRFMVGCIALFEQKSGIKRNILIICFIIILMSETLYLLPVYSIFLFSSFTWKNRTYH